MIEFKAAIPELLWEELCLALNDREESAGVILAGEAREQDRLALCLNRVIWAPPDAYELRSSRELRIRSSGWMPAVGDAAAGDWQPIFFHTHPGGDPLPSALDVRVASDLAPVFQARCSSPYASLILGGTAEAPRFTGTFGGETWRALRVAGDRIRLLPAEDAETYFGDLRAFDRQVRAFGEAGQRLLRRLRIGVVGAGGTGSAVFEQLVRLGVGSIVLLDDDFVTERNLTRIHGATRADIGRAKVEVLARTAAEVGLGTEVVAHRAKVTDRQAFEALRGCDVVFGCTDDNSGRAILSRLAYYYVVPVLDVGVVISSRDGQLTGLDARATIMVPGTPCLHCRDRIDPHRLREEMLDVDEREQLAEEGYAQGLADPDPAVIAYTTMIASFAVDEMLQRLFGFGDDAPSSEILVRPAQRTIRRLGGAARDGHFCADPWIVARGDREPPLGLLWS